MPTLTLKKQRFARALSAILVATSDDLERPHLSQVQVWQQGDRFNLAGTTGHWLAVWSEVVSESFATKRIGISLRDAKFLAAVLGLDRPADAEEAEGEEIELQLAAGIEIECDRWTLRLPDTDLSDKVPDLDALVKGTERGAIPCIALNPSLVADVRKAFKIAGALKTEFEQIEWGFGPTILSPVLATSERVPDLACVLMPMQPADVDVQEADGERRYVRRDTGEVMHTEPVAKQQFIAGTEPDPVKASGEALQASVDAAGVEVRVYADGEKVAELKPRKRAKKQTAEVAP